MINNKQSEPSPASAWHKKSTETPENINLLRHSPYVPENGEESDEISNIDTQKLLEPAPELANTYEILQVASVDQNVFSHDHKAFYGTNGTEIKTSAEASPLNHH